MGFQLTSSAFNDGDKIPSVYTCDGKNNSPPLAWRDAPTGTLGFALVVNDPDAPAGDWGHWVLYNIPSSVTHLDEAFDSGQSSLLEGKNSWGHERYDGPCPPSGVHRYIFTLYALSHNINEPSLTKTQLLSRLKGITLDKTTLMGRYQKQ